MRRARGSGAVAANRFAVIAVPREARQLLTVDAAFMHDGFPLWASAQDRVEQGDRPFTLGRREQWGGCPPIVRLLPPANATDATIAAVRKAFEGIGAHVRVLAREREQTTVVAPAGGHSEPPNHTGIREAVLYVMRNEVKAVNPDTLAAMVEQTMLECGL